MSGGKHTSIENVELAIVVQSRCDVLEHELVFNMKRLCFIITGNFYPNNLGSGNMERFFFTLAILMTINTLVFWRISQRYGSSIEYDIIMIHLSVYRTLYNIFGQVHRSERGNEQRGGTQSPD